MKTLVNFILSMAAVYFILSIAIINGFGVTVIDSPVSTGRVAAASVEAPETTGVPIIDEINNIRINNGVSPLLIDNNLIAAANYRSLDMINNDYYSHINEFGNDYTSLLTTESSFSCENLDLSEGNDISTIINDWMNSKSGHKECLLDTRATKVGVSIDDYGLTQTSGKSTFVSVLILTN